MLFGERKFYLLLDEPEFAFLLCHRRRFLRKALVSLARAGDAKVHDCLRGMAEFLYLDPVTRCRSGSRSILSTSFHYRFLACAGRDAVLLKI